ncbi:glycoside hydrolase family 3 protein [Pseudolysinimonas kribbensis]|uniref:Beta-N-acetylhexosaminidase n=2 Tax=Pseudolysinimonas kribbensis TaxID=433641 RepID=A0ABQ6KBI8_9MICO|nr:beta-N-acetylhexosaminidase [Pseudolysinimonas kribbensis]
MRRRMVVILVIAVVALAGCAAGHPAPSHRTPTPTATPTPPPDPLAGLTLQQEVGQLFVVGTPTTGLGPDALSAIRDSHVGGVFLGGRSLAGVQANSAVGRAAQAASGDGIPLIVSTDQEGGEVQVLQGPGFDRMPTAVDQGAMSPQQLLVAAERWGAQLHAAGVNLDLAPVSDIVPPGFASQNPPIGVFQREYGSDAAAVETHAAAFAAGLRDAGVLAAAKHFPGLGHVTANTDTHSGVTDTTIDASSPDVRLYGRLAHSGVDVVMVSSAIYAKIDPSQPAAFSPAVVGILRDTLDFTGITITDDLSGAVQVASVAPGDRAIRTITAGVDLVLVSHPTGVWAQMVDAVLARAGTDPAFRAKVDDAARRVLRWKQAHLG